MNNKYLYVIFLVIGFILGVLLMIGVSFFTKDDIDENFPIINTDKNKTDINESNNIVLSEDERIKYDNLKSIGVQLYNSKKYLEFNKQTNGLYVVSLKELRDLGYDLVDYKDCDNETNIIYFDPNKVLSQEYSDYPIQINLFCDSGN